MIHLFIFTEEKSFELLTEILLPELVSEKCVWRVFSHQGKQDLEQAVKKIVPSISRIPGARILITRDQDMEDCLEVKKKIIETIDGKCESPYKIRIVCRALENWFLGDLKAVEKSYSGFKSKNYENKSEFREIDNIQNAHLVLQKIIPQYKNHAYLPKLETAQSIGPNMDLKMNRSKSFQNFIKAVQDLLV